MIINYINKIENKSKIYSFTTENIAGYYKYLNFENKNILTVSASGDHIINAFYKGAKTVTGFDINYLALLFTELKLVALENLEYEDFLQFFMINEKDNTNKNMNALDYTIYTNKLREHLTIDAVSYFDTTYKDFNNNGYELRNSYIFNNKYDKNNLKIYSNLYLKNETEYNIAKQFIKNKQINLINSDFRYIKKLSNLEEYDIILMSNISDYIKEIYNESYLEKYFKDIILNFKNNTNKIVCAYLYDIKNTNYRSDIDNPILRQQTLDKLNVKYTEEKFESVIKNCTDSVLII